MTVPDHHKAIARHVADRWHVRPRIEAWRADGTTVRQAISIAVDCPGSGATAYSTIGLSDHGGYEIAGVAASRNRSFVKAFFDVASYVVDGHRSARPWVVFEKAIGRYYTRSETPHLVLADVPPVGLVLADLGIGPRTIRWLYVVPLTSDEAVFVEAEGGAALRPYLESMAIDVILDLNRSTLPGVPRFDPWA
jgi:Suppressor of fused protein (SUFU)